MKYGSEKFLALVESLEGLPTIGRKSAMRLALHMLLNDTFGAMKLAHAIEEAIVHVRRCSACNNISEDELCPICSDPGRHQELLCLVTSVKDLMTIEETGSFKGRYFVIEEATPETLEQLRDLVATGVQEVLFAFSPSIASDALILYLEEKLSDFHLSFTRIAQGVPTGVSFENLDLMSVARAIESRIRT
ncbi:MAG: recombination mediator RecR [Campylobacterales bacterium]